MSQICKNCGAQLNPSAKFCASCGTSTDISTGTGLGTGTGASTAKKPKSPKKKLLISGIAAVLVIALTIALLPKLKLNGNDSDNALGGAGDLLSGAGDSLSGTGDSISVSNDLSDISYTEQDYAVKAKKLTISPEHPSATEYGVSIDFGEYGIDKTQTLEIRELPEKIVSDDDLKVTAYDFSLCGKTEAGSETEAGGKTDFNDVISIAIPYDAKYAEAGAESECIGAKYFNQTTGEWEGVYYELDTANRQVLIYTTHLSTYGVFQVKNENTRKAYITDVYAIASLLGTGKSNNILQELSDNGKPGTAAFEAGFEAVNSVVGNTGTAVTAITLGGQYEGALAESLGAGTQHLGLALAVVQTCYDFAYKFSDDAEKLSTLSNLVKNIGNNAVGYFGSSALQVGFAAVVVFDIILSTVQSDMMEIKLENLGGVYQYYNDTETPRSAAQWRKLFIEIMENNADNPDTAQKLIQQEIDTFCNRFWALDYGKVKEIAAVSGLKYSFDERNWTKDRQVLTAQYREHLMARLQAPLTSSRKFLLTRAMNQAQNEFEKRLRALQKGLNKTVRVQIIEQPEKDGEYKYGGYTVRFAPLSGNADAKGWTGKMPESGTLNTSFTILGHMQSGLPNKVELYAPGEDTPTLSVPFKVSYPNTTILLKSNEDKPDEPDDSEVSDSTAPIDPEQPGAKQEYAWVLVETINEMQEADIENTNKGNIYQKSASAAPGSYSFSWKYIGESDDYYDPDMLNGESFATQLTFSVPPTVIQGGETVSLSFNLSFTEQNLSFFDGNDGCRADWSDLHFTNAAGKNFFKIYSSVKYKDKNVSSVSDTISAVIPAGSSEGQQEKLWTGSYTGTYYVYEWRAVD